MNICCCAVAYVSIPHPPPSPHPVYQPSLPKTTSSSTSIYTRGNSHLLPIRPPHTSTTPNITARPDQQYRMVYGVVGALVGSNSFHWPNEHLSNSRKKYVHTPFEKCVAVVDYAFVRSNRFGLFYCTIYIYILLCKTATLISDLCMDSFGNAMQYVYYMSL